MAVNTLEKINADRKFSDALREQNYRHSIGQIEPELAARMTKPKVADTQYQLYVDIKGEDGSRPVSPRFSGAEGQEACAQILTALNSQICLGKLPGWGNARIEPIVPITAS